MATLSTHVLDTARGRPAADVAVTLERDGVPVGRGVTDGDGRIREFSGAGRLERGSYRLMFAVGEYFAARNVESLYSVIPVEFTVREDGHYHIPLLLAPHGYSTYRGS